MHFRGAEKQVDLRQRVDQFRFVTFDHAADGDDGLTSTFGLETSRLDHGVDGFFLGGVDEATRIDDDQISLAKLRREFGGIVGQLREVSLAIDCIFVAAKGDDADFHETAGMGPGIAHASVNDSSRT